MATLVVEAVAVITVTGVATVAEGTMGTIVGMAVGVITAVPGAPGGVLIFAGVDQDGGVHGRCHLVIMRHHLSSSSNSPLYLSNRSNSKPITGITARIPRGIIPILKVVRSDGCVWFLKRLLPTLDGVPSK